MGRRLGFALLVASAAAALAVLSCNDGLVQAVDAHLELTDDAPPVPAGDGEITVVDERAVEVELRWSAATDAHVEAERLEYRVYHSDSAALETKDQVLSNGTPASEWTAALTEYTMTGLEQDTEYEVNVLVRDVAAIPNVAAYQRKVVRTIVDNTEPDVANPELVPSNQTPYSFRVSWTEASDNIDTPDRLSYQVYYSATESVGTVAEMVANGTSAGPPQTGVTSVTVTGLDEDTTYNVNVMARDAAGNSAHYTMRTVATLVDQPPDPGTGVLSDSDNAAYSLRVSWAAATDDVDSAASLTYQVYYSVTSNIGTVGNLLANGTPVAAPEGGITTRLVSALAQDSAYFFNVLVQDTAGKQAVYSMTQFSTVPDAPPVPGGGVEFSSVQVDGFTVSWDPAADVEDPDGLQYRVFYTDSGPNDMDDYAEAVALATPANAFTTDLTTLAISGLDEITDYYVNIFVRDRMDNPVPYGTESQRTARLDRIYWTNHTADIYRTFLDYAGEPVEEILNNASGNYTGIAIDYDAERLYWADASTGRLLTMQLEGAGGAEEVISSGMSYPFGLDITSNGGFLFVSDFTGDTIYRVPSSLRGQAITHGSVDTIFTSVGSGPAGIALSADEQDLYFIQYNANHISVVDVTSLSVTTDVLPPSQFTDPVAIAADDRAIYWTDYGTSTTDDDGRVEYALLPNPGNPANWREMITSQASAPQGITLGPSGELYWIDYTTNYIYKIDDPVTTENAAASAYEYIAADGPNGIAIYAEYP